MKIKKENKKWIIAIGLLAIVAILLFRGQLASISGACPLLPKAIYSGVYNSSTGLSLGSCGFSSLSDGTPVLWAYDLTYNTDTSFAGVISEGSSVRFLIVKNQTYEASANLYDVQQIQQINGTIAGIQSQLTSDLNSGSCGYNGYTCTALNTQIQDFNQNVQILQNAINYNTAMMSVSNSTNTNTLSSTTTPTTAATTTVSTTVATTSSSSNSPPSAWLGITNWINLLNVNISNFISSIIASFSSYFNLPTNLLSISAGNINQSTNTIKINTVMPVTVSLNIPTNKLSQTWHIGLDNLTETSCISYVYQNQTKAFVYQSPVYNATTTPYAYSFNYVPTAVGIYVLGASCQSSSTTYSSATGWTAWSTPAQVANATIAIEVINTSITPPTTNTNITNSSNLLSGIASFISGIISSFANFIKGLGL